MAWYTQRIRLVLGALLREMSAGRQGLWIVDLHLEFGGVAAGISLLLIA